MKSISAAAKKNALAAAILLMPFLFMAWMMACDSGAAKRLAEQEIAGVQALRPVKAALGLLAPVPPAKAELPATTEAIKAALSGQAAAAALIPTGKASALFRVLKNVGISAGPADAIDKTADVIALLSDNAGLARDAETAAHALGDTLAVHTTGVLVEAHLLLTALSDAEIDRQTSADRKSSEASRVAFAKARDGIALHAGKAAAKIEKVLEGDADGAMKEALGAKTAALTAAAAKVEEAVKARSAHAVRAAAAEVIHAAEALNGPLCDVLERRLQARLQELQRKTAARLAGSFALLLAALGAAGWLMRAPEAAGAMPTQTEEKEQARDQRKDEESARRKNEERAAKKNEERAARVEAALAQFGAVADGLFTAVEAAEKELTSAVPPDNAQLARQAEKLGGIVGLARDIAAQANLLSLNAAVEVARAGDAGRNFTSIAAEAKALAQQTAQAMEGAGRQVAALQQAVAALPGGAGSRANAGTARALLDKAEALRQEAKKLLSAMRA